MESLFRFVSPPSSCGYLPNYLAELEYEFVGHCTPREYLVRMENGWRRFGHSLFHPVCRDCRKCLSLRIDVERFTPNRSQRRAWAANPDVELHIVRPSVNRENLDLYDRFHAYQSLTKGWPSHPPKEAGDYASSFVDNPFPTEEWNFRIGKKLVGCGYVDHLPGAFSAIYFFHDPQERKRSLGTFNILSMLNRARQLRYRWVYLGYYVEGCGSLEYKAHFRPNEVYRIGHGWEPFRDA